MKWQPIETAPKGEVIMLGWWFAWPNMEPSWECEIEFYDGTDTAVTHWMPLPPPPGKE